MTLGAEGQLRRAGSRVDEQASLGIRRDARHFADVDVIGQPLQQVGQRIDTECPERSKLRGERAPIRQNGRSSTTPQCLMEASAIHLASDVRAGPAGPSISFCARHDTISPTRISLSFLQSMSCTVRQLAKRLARLPELADDRAVELHLEDLAGHRIHRRRFESGFEFERTDTDAGRANADRPRRSDVLVHRPQREIVAEHLDAAVVAIGRRRHCRRCRR